MTAGKGNTHGRPAIPPPQQHLRTAQRKAVEALLGQAAAQLQWLGAQDVGAEWRLPVLNGAFLVQPETGAVSGEGREPIHPTWQILTLHYLALRAQPAAESPAVTFASLPSGQNYALVYENRVNRRLCATVGRDARTLAAAAAALAARAVPGGDVAFEVNLFPRIPLRLIWYAGDQEFAPSCTLLVPANIEDFLCTEDIVVMSEAFVARLGGKPF